ncbi:hypothetical protein JWV37_04150 [Sulfurospirillum sp. T05]|uniref:Uncharacterized protein n=1 Tax=Sulfurospirillum tamanense TaxID=2813362 RepID=A0ABS2WQU6_9BACT|nr:hypothetical protein [Sulfurospirillum tamanensis]MBN2963965.1 hypothetical protein [Sulfurospirillum tamanensis]
MPRLVNAPLKIAFEPVVDEALYIKEFEKLSFSDEDPVGQWLKIAKARGETGESDPVLLTLMVELHRKIDSLGAYVRNEQTQYLALAKHAEIDQIGFEYFHLEVPVLETGKRYYGRILMPVFPKREFPLFFEAEGKDLAKMVRLHEGDESDWNAYVMARERIMIRQIKAKRDGF